MEEIVQIIVSYISIWMPAITAVLGIVGSVIVAINRIKASAVETKAAIAELKKDETIKALRADVEASLKENKAIREQYDILIDELKHIKDYRENRK